MLRKVNTGALALFGLVSVFHSRRVKTILTSSSNPEESAPSLYSNLDVNNDGVASLRALESFLLALSPRVASLYPHLAAPSQGKNSVLDATGSVGSYNTHTSRGEPLGVRSGMAHVRKTTPEASADAAPLKIVVAGGGVGGLTAALGLLKKGFDVTLYERTAKFLRFGGPIQFASNSLSSLKAIDEKLFERVMDKFTFTGTRRCGLKDGLRADGKFSMTPVVDPRYVFDETVPADWYVEFPLKQCADFFKLPYTGVINRPDLQEILLDQCQSIKPDFIKNGVSVKQYTNTPDGVTVELSDGSSVSADILVGADGIWSSVRAQMYNEGEVKCKSDDGLTQQGCAYSGYTVFAGEFVPEKIEDFADYFDCGYKVYIGPKQYFVTSDVGDGRIQWYSFHAQPPGTKRADDSWEGGESSKEKGNDVITYITGLYDGWSDEIKYVLDSTPAGSVEQRDLYDRWPEFFRSWADDSVVLLGDAVHPMMPNLGQGGGMAIEDSYELAELLKVAVEEAGGNKPEPEVLRSTLQKFYEKRVGRVAGVSLLSRLASDLIINFFGTPWSPHDSKGNGPLSYLTFFWKPILQYIVFPLQFLFLYSYHPTGGMGDLPKQLEAAWRERHRVSALEAFAKAKSEGQSAGAPSFFAASADSAT